MNPLLEAEHELHRAAEIMLSDSPLMGLLKQLGQPIITGSYTTGLMTYPDIDLCIQSDTTTYQDLIKLIPKVHALLNERNLKVADFSKDEAESAICYFGVEFDYNNYLWHISATITKPGPIGDLPDLPQLSQWLAKMTENERITILKLKNELLAAQRYGSSHAKPPYTYHSAQLYEGVLAGKAKTVEALDRYFTKYIKKD
jgi:hypothetical protein